MQAARGYQAQDCSLSLWPLRDSDITQGGVVCFQVIAEYTAPSLTELQSQANARVTWALYVETQTLGVGQWQRELSEGEGHL